MNVDRGIWTNWWIAATWILTGINTCCILMSLVLIRRKIGKAAVMVDDETQTLEEGKSDQTIPSRVLITKTGKAAQCRNDCPLLLKLYSIQSLGWCSQCDPSDVLEKRTWRRRVGP